MELLHTLSLIGDDDDDGFGNDREDGFVLDDDDSLDFGEGDEDDDEKNPLGIEGIGEDY